MVTIIKKIDIRTALFRAESAAQCGVNSYYAEAAIVLAAEVLRLQGELNTLRSDKAP